MVWPLQLAQSRPLNTMPTPTTHTPTQLTINWPEITNHNQNREKEMLSLANTLWLKLTEPDVLLITPLTPSTDSTQSSAKKEPSKSSPQSPKFLHQLPQSTHLITHQLPLRTHLITLHSPLPIHLTTHHSPLPTHLTTHQSPLPTHLTTLRLLHHTTVKLFSKNLWIPKESFLYLVMPSWD